MTEPTVEIVTDEIGARLLINERFNLKLCAFKI